MTYCLVTWDSHRKIWEFTDKKTHILTNLNQKFYFIYYIWFKLFSLFDFSVYLPFFSVRFAFARINLLYPRKIYQVKFLLKNYKPKMCIDIATLTGQAAVIFDYKSSVIMGNNNKYIQKIYS